MRMLKGGSSKPGPVVYWMSRDQRARDNWALIYAQEIALKRNEPLIVVLTLAREFLDATLRQYAFMLNGLREASEALRERNIPFYLLSGSPGEEIVRFTRRFGIGAIVTDFDPLRVKQQWKSEVAKEISIPFYEVDAHNIVPCWHASAKQDFAARTFRPRVTGKLEEFCDSFPPCEDHPILWKRQIPEINWKNLMSTLNIDSSIAPVTWIKPGEAAAGSVLKNFVNKKLSVYEETRNNPSSDGQSHFSPYLHFGQISAQRIALEVRKQESTTSHDSFLEELIVRRELSDNFCFYNAAYDSTAAFPQWARRTLEDHGQDERPYLYSLEELELSRTHDPLWNAAQTEMVKKGKMHGYMRMYWAKKILEWSNTPEEALNKAIYMNDRYELDGRDPNGYVGCAWAIGGVHDRAWFQRPVFGKIRYMSYNGCKKKFNADMYIENVQRL